MEKLSLQKVKSPLYIYISLLVILIGVIPAESRGLGGLGGAFLRAPVGANAFGRGGAYTANPQYLTMWWNPAALFNVKKRVASLGTGYRTLNRAEAMAGYEFRIPPRLALGLSVLYRGDAKIELYDNDEYPLAPAHYTTFTMKLAGAYLISRKATAGFNFNVLYQKIPTGGNQDSIAYSSTNTIGFDAAFQYKINKKMTAAVVLKNIFTTFSWEFSDGLSPIGADTLPASVNVGFEYKGTLMGKPFIWTSDIIGYAFNGNFKGLDKKSAFFNNGFRWEKWDILALHVGVRDWYFNRDFIKKPKEYWSTFTVAPTMGCEIDFSKQMKKDFKVNYGMAFDKVGKGISIDQQLDFVLNF